jgi:hypothetical protein
LPYEGRCVGGYVSGELQLRFTVHFLESSHASRWVDPWLFCDYFQRAVSGSRSRPAAKARLPALIVVLVICPAPHQRMT